jgi:hypothetical protein
MRPVYGIYSGFYNQYHNNDHWIFVRNNDLGKYDLYNYYVNRSDYSRIIENSSVVDHSYYDRRRQTTYISGPNRREVERITGNSVRSVTVRDIDLPGQQLNNNRLQLYRPQFNVSGDRDQLRIPARIDGQDIRQLPVGNREKIQQQLETSPEYGRPVRQVAPENQPVNRNENERVQPTTPARVPVENTGRQSQPVNRSTNEKVVPAPPAKVPLETPRRTRQPVPDIP